MNSSTLAPFTAPAPIAVFAAEEGLEPEGLEPAGGSASSRGPFIGCARMLHAGCYSVSLFGSGAGYDAF